jgi:hypothetical protein
MASICTMFENTCGIAIDVTPETCIIGMLSGDHFNIKNTCIIIIKYFIFTGKLQNTTPVFIECVEQIKYYKKLYFDSLYLCAPKQSIFLRINGKKYCSCFRNRVVYVEYIRLFCMCYI